MTKILKCPCCHQPCDASTQNKKLSFGQSHSSKSKLKGRLINETLKRYVAYIVANLKQNLKNEKYLTFKKIYVHKNTLIKVILISVKGT
jgi:hypothetical protein